MGEVADAESSGEVSAIEKKAAPIAGEVKLAEEKTEVKKSEASDVVEPKETNVSDDKKEGWDAVPTKEATTTEGENDSVSKGKRKTHRRKEVTEVSKVELDLEAYRLGVKDMEEVVVQQQDDPDSPLYSIASFEEMGLRETLLQGIYALKYNKPSRIQGKAIPYLVDRGRRNLIAQAQSGTGKTAAFSISLLHHVDESVPKPQAVVIAPTRELARQILAVIKQIARFTKITSTLVAKGIEYPRGYRIPEHVIVGTPGRLKSVISNRTLDGRGIKILILDEADVLIAADQNNSLADQCRMFRSKLPQRGLGVQTALFSATYSGKVKQFALKMVEKPTIIRVERKKLSLEGIKQYYLKCQEREEKFDLLSTIYSLLTIAQSIVFVQTRNTAKQLFQRMTAEGHQVSLLHGGDMDPLERDHVIDDFRRGRTRVLIATNVLARGIDIQQVSMVINFDMPYDGNKEPDRETYLHRIGRSGRFGRSGLAINFVDGKMAMDAVVDFQKFFQRDIELTTVEGLEKIARSDGAEEGGDEEEGDGGLDLHDDED